MHMHMSYSCISDPDARTFARVEFECIYTRAHVHLHMHMHVRITYIYLCMCVVCEPSRPWHAYGPKVRGKVLYMQHAILICKYKYMYNASYHNNNKIGLHACMHMGIRYSLKQHSAGQTVRGYQSATGRSHHLHPSC